MSQAADVADSYFAAATARDAAGMASHWSDDGVEDLVPIGVLRGPGEVRSFFTELFTAVPDFEFVVERITAAEGVAAVQWRASGTFSGGPFQGIDPTGRRLDLRGCDCVEVADGSIVRNTAYWDNMAFARGVGMMPPLDSPAERAMKTAFNGLTKLRGALR